MKIPLVPLLLLTAAHAFAISEFTVSTRLVVDSPTGADFVEETITKGAPPVSDNWPAIQNAGGTASSTAYCAWGDVRCAINYQLNEIYPEPPNPYYGGSAQSHATWTETCTITGGSGDSAAIFLLTQSLAYIPGQEFYPGGGISKDGDFLFWLGGNGPDAGDDQLYQLPFTYGVSFTLMLDLDVQQGWSNVTGGRVRVAGGAEYKVKRILLPAGAVLHCATPIPEGIVINQALTIEPAGENARLHWFGTASSGVLTNSILTTPPSWGGASGNPVPIGVFEYEMLVPISEERRFFTIWDYVGH